MEVKNNIQSGAVISKKPQLNYIDYFRAIAIICIVAGHTAVVGHDKVHHINFFIFPGATNYFIFIAGFLFQYLSYKFNILDFYKKKFLNVIMPYLCILFPFALYYSLHTEIKGVFANFSKPLRFFGTMLFGCSLNVEMWFIGLISVFFIFAPLILYIKNKNSKLWYGIFFYALYCTMAGYRPGLNILGIPETMTFSQIAVTYLNFFFKSFLYFSSYWLGGMIVCDVIEKNPEFMQKYKTTLYWIFSVGLLLTFSCVVFDIKSFPFYTYPYYTYTKICMGGMCFCLFYFNEAFICAKPLLHKALKFVAKYSFGIYFIHSYFFYYMYHRTIFIKDAPWVYNVYPDKLKSFFIGWGIFFISFFGSIITLSILKFILNKLGVKNTRKFIGV